MAIANFVDRYFIVDNSEAPISILIFLCYDRIMKKLTATFWSLATLAGYLLLFFSTIAPRISWADDLYLQCKNHKLAMSDGVFYSTVKLSDRATLFKFKEMDAEVTDEQIIVKVKPPKYTFFFHKDCNTTLPEKIRFHRIYSRLGEKLSGLILHDYKLISTIDAFVLNLPKGKTFETSIAVDRRKACSGKIKLGEVLFSGKCRRIQK